MIIVRSPLRITLGGGGTDLPSYYRDHGGFLVAAAIDKYVYSTVHQTFIDDLIVKYSELERVGSVDDLKHPIVREAFKVVGMTSPRELRGLRTALRVTPRSTTSRSAAMNSWVSRGLMKRDNDCSSTSS